MSRLNTAKQLICMIGKGNLCQSDRIAIENIEACIKCGYVSPGQLQTLEMVYRRSIAQVKQNTITPKPIAPTSPKTDPGEIAPIPRARGRMSAEARRAYARAKEEQATSAAMKDPKYVSMAHLEMERARAKTRELLRGKNT